MSPSTIEFGPADEILIFRELIRQSLLRYIYTREITFVGKQRIEGYVAKIGGEGFQLVKEDSLLLVPSGISEVDFPVVAFFHCPEF